ncbi:monocarboxylate transporter 2-like isoform X2 [Cimex lectularius]|uniref:Uncharacterized protein n=1 Tax=Cimex lectularius TaxID=79782 RepID=A0A8I6SRE2_CIMLE|nr:monocarboxylate transporter 2-like isoform X2 [Cimex lectularius]
MGLLLQRVWSFLLNQGSSKLFHKKFSTVLPISIDGGYGWVIVAITFIGVFTVDGIAYTFYILMPGLIKDGLTESNCALSIATINSLSMLIAPLSSSLCNAIGFRTVMIIGSVISCLGFAMSYFAITLFGFLGYYFTFGILGGIGLGLMYLPMSVAPSMWFDTKRPLAVGIATCGTGIGMIVIPFLLEYLTTCFHYRTLNLVIAALMSVNVITAVFLRPAPTIEIEVDNKNEPEKGVTARKFIGNFQFKVKETDSSFSASHSFRQFRSKRTSKLMSRSTISLLKLKEKRSYSVNSHFNEEDTIMDYSMHVYYLPTKKDVNEPTCKVCCPESLVRTISNMASYTLLETPKFLCFCGSGLSFYAVVTVPILFINTYMKQSTKDVDPHHLQLLIPFMGLGVFVGRLGGGILLHIFPTIKALALCLIIHLLISTSSFLLTFFAYYPFYFIYSSLYGLCFGLYGSLRNLLLVDYIGLENLTPATGILFTIAGLSNLIGPPVAVEITGGGKHLDLAFYFTSIMFTVSTICLLPLICAKKAISN